MEKGRNLTAFLSRSLYESWRAIEHSFGFQTQHLFFPFSFSRFSGPCRAVSSASPVGQNGCITHCFQTSSLLRLFSILNELSPVQISLFSDSNPDVIRGGLKVHASRNKNGRDPLSRRVFDGDRVAHARAHGGSVLAFAQMTPPPRGNSPPHLLARCTARDIRANALSYRLFLALTHILGRLMRPFKGRSRP